MVTLSSDGFQWVRGVIDQTACDALLTALDSGDGAVSARGAAIYAQRNVLTNPVVQKLAHSRELLALTGEAQTPVRAIFFDKVPGANWHVGWHQDRAIAVKERIDTLGWGPWSTKAGVVHVLPPAYILEKLVAVRLHLDDCGEDNGPLRVIPKTHTHGILTDTQIQRYREDCVEVICTGERGDALLLKPLTVHASAPALRPDHRRVLHIEYAPDGLLPPPLEWAFTG